MAAFSKHRTKLLVINILSLCVFQDIRRFFGPTGGSKKLESQAPAKAKSSESQPKKQTKKGASFLSATSLKSKPSRTLKQEEDVEIISDSDEEPTSKKVDKRSSGRGQLTPSKSKKPADAKAKKTEKPALNAKHTGSKGPDPNSKGKTLKTDSESESEVVGKRSSKRGRKKTRVIDSDLEGEDESPFKGKKASKNKRCSQEKGDPEEEVVKSEGKKPRKASRRNVVVSGAVLQRKLFFSFLVLSDYE